MPKERGVVNTWNIEKQFGFVSCNSGKPDAFLHSENIRNRDLRDDVKVKGLKRGDRIRFDLETPETGRGKMVAINIELDNGGDYERERGGGGGGRRRSASRSRSARRRSPSDRSASRRRRSPSGHHRSASRRGSRDSRRRR
eukprot:NODE_3776_length_743_cov_367.063953.p1 GENE.NODE_3776_length_743_cov_367.063953~~NODE_3776_length_743_cov_367.063953.p1  ORF type:complete len:141 (-),score=15.03 NODE_3776_length_743_cov_367.063953:139-561(-)